MPDFALISQGALYGGNLLRTAPRKERVHAAQQGLPVSAVHGKQHRQLAEFDTILEPEVYFPSILALRCYLSLRPTPL